MHESFRNAALKNRHEVEARNRNRASLSGGYLSPNKIHGVEGTGDDELPAFGECCILRDKECLQFHGECDVGLRRVPWRWRVIDYALIIAWMMPTTIAIVT